MENNLNILNSLQFGDFKKSLGLFSWNDIKRFPQSLKRKSKIGSFTFDEEFDMLHRDLGVLEGNIGTLVRYSKLFGVHTKRLVDHCGEIGLSVQSLLDPYNTFNISVRESIKTKAIGEIPSNVFSSKEERTRFYQDYKCWNAVGIYVDQINSLKRVLNDPSKICNIIERKCKKFLVIIEEIKVKVKARNHALDDYDGVFNELEGLYLKAKTKDLSAKESQLQFNLERKQEHYRAQYTQINDLFKKELPFFFKLAELFIKPINYIFFYHQLLMSYQIATCLYPLQQALKFTVEEISTSSWDRTLVKESTELVEANEKLIKQLNILDFRDYYYKDFSEFKELVDPTPRVIGETYKEVMFDPSSNYCRVLYDYKAQQEGDLNLHRGDILRLINQEGQWWEGSLFDRKGKFPYNYVEVLPSIYS